MRKSYNHLKNEKGYTLVELLATTILIGIVTISILSIFSQGIKSWYIATDSVEIQQNSRYVMNQMVETIRELDKDKLEISSDNYLLLEGRNIFYLCGTDIKNEFNLPVASNICDLQFTKKQMRNGRLVKVENTSSHWDLLSITLSVKNYGKVQTYNTNVLPRN
ncbi:PilW family protein [Natranaerobius trueperi]|uniref:Prepilin-type cleavage/methylation domain-containing protein n=1 Tax=Natranaerobius trueperi TaxID=759412 RepID=A0A226C0S4_9FIRM|nr:prepilin-type N-terminal cleavage/methylation domain-containing protein [Natranaerobius trueperi]OWZ84049.1 hypothetical protein CDO51_05680 [Natranaerobius trueperi]